MTGQARAKLGYLAVMVTGSDLESVHKVKGYIVQSNCHALTRNLLHDK
jgi:hypothetical protein